MYIKYGNDSRGYAEGWVSHRRDGLFVNGMSRGYTETWTIQGMLQAASVAALTTAIQTLQAAYAIQGQDLALLNNDGSPTALSLPSSKCIGGVRIIGQPHFSDLRNAQYSTYVEYTIVAEGEVFDTSASILMFEETISLRGGGPQFVLLETLNGPPQKQYIKQQTTFYASQSGRAIGYFGPPAAPAPLWPYAEMINQRQRSATTPKRNGPPGQAVYTEFPITWSYEFADSTSLFGYPNIGSI